MPGVWRPPVSEWVPLPIGSELVIPFGVVLDGRASRRRLEPPSRDALGALLWHGARVRSMVGGREGRAAPSAGGLHPLSLVVVEQPLVVATLYDPIRHALARLEVDETDVGRACSSLVEVLPDARGSFVFALADFERTAAAYEHSESLVWRDAGCLFATLHLTAAALGLGSCLMGILGAELAAIVVRDQRVLPVGVLAVGVAGA